MKEARNHFRSKSTILRIMRLFVSCCIIGLCSDCCRAFRMNNFIQSPRSKHPHGTIYSIHQRTGKQFSRKLSGEIRTNSQKLALEMTNGNLNSVVSSETIASRVTSNSIPVELRHTEFPLPESKDVSAGINARPPAILLHGLLGSKRNFQSLGTSLVKQLQKKRRVLAVDLRNHGENHHDWRDDMSYTSMVQDVISFLDKEGFQDAVLVGHSMGGKVAQAAALLHPERVSGLVVLDIAPVRYDAKVDGSWKAIQQIIDVLASIQLSPGKTKRDVDVELRKSGVIQDPALRAFVLTNIDAPPKGQEGSLTWKINIDCIARELDVIAGFDIDSVNGERVNDAQSVKRQYSGDTFIIHGGASRFVRSSHMQTIGECFPNHMLTTVRGAGHWVHAEAPDDTLALLKRYLDR